MSIISFIRRIGHGDLTYKVGLNKTLMSSILSYCENSMLLDSGANMENSMIYQYHKKLHELTNIRKISNLKEERVGRSKDGGYVMVTPFSQEKIAYSIGIADDVSWDKQMANDGYDVYMYDHTIKKCPEKNSKFHWKKIGVGGGK